MTDLTPEALAELKRKAEAATPGNLDTAEDVVRGEETDCPLCGEGTVEMDTFSNFDGFAMGVQFYGIGDEFVNYEAFFRAANPQTVLALIARIEADAVEKERLQANLERETKGRDEAEEEITQLRAQVAAQAGEIEQLKETKDAN